jgi:hypothetical protein
MINGRMAEWLTAAIMLVFAATLAMPGDVIAESPIFAFFDRFGIEEGMLAFSMGAVGAARMMALYINGSWRRTPWVRMVGAMLGAAMFAFLSVSFTWPFFSGLRETFPLMPGIFAVLSIFDIIAAYRAGYDARRVQPHL